MSIKLQAGRVKAFGLLLLLLSGLFSSLSIPVFALNNKYDETFYSNNNIVFYNPEDVRICAEQKEEEVLVGADNKEKIWNYLISNDLSSEQAAGILGNIQYETDGTFSPTFNQSDKNFGDDDNGGYGIGQWADTRRTNLVDKLKELFADIMTNYYTVEYSSPESYPNPDQGFISNNTETNEFMPQEDNNGLLSAQLNFLIDESKSRTLSDTVVDKGYGSDTDIEWDILKKQKTVSDATKFWAYSFQGPDGEDETITDRKEYSENILSTYSSASKDEDETARASACSTGKAVHPIADGTLVTEGYGGPRGHALGKITCGPKGDTWHNGYDIAGTNNKTVVVSSMSGVVTKIDTDRPALNTVYIQNQDGFIIRYMHMNTGYIDVAVGDTVTAGQPIGKVGTGNGNYGSHLHVEIDVAGNTNTQVAALHANNCGKLRSVNPNDFYTLFGVSLCPNGGCDNLNTAY